MTTVSNIFRMSSTFTRQYPCPICGVKEGEYCKATKDGIILSEGEIMTAYVHEERTQKERD